MAFFYLLQVGFGSALLIIAAVLLIVAAVLWAAGTHSENSHFAGMFGAWGLGFLGIGVIVIALA